MVFIFFDVWTTEDGSVSPCDFSLPTIYSAFYCLVQCPITAFSDSADSGHVHVSGVLPPPPPPMQEDTGGLFLPCQLGLRLVPLLPMLVQVKFPAPFTVLYLVITLESPTRFWRWPLCAPRYNNRSGGTGSWRCCAPNTRRPRHQPPRAWTRTLTALRSYQSNKSINFNFDQKIIHKHQINITPTQQPLKDRALSGVGQLWRGRS